MNTELCINIWFIVDIGTELCYNWSIKAYNLFGDDDTKIKCLTYLSETDYISVGREYFPKNFKTVFNNMTVEGQIPISQINFQIDNNINFYISELENKLPPLFKFNGKSLTQNVAVKQKISDNPLFVSTILMENEFGEIRPYTTLENKSWFQNEKRRLDIASKIKHK